MEVPSDLKNAVDVAVRAGELTAMEAGHAYAHLDEGIRKMQEEYGWFPEDGANVLNEVEVMDTDGAVYRPDRVVEKDGHVVIVDYKFGAHRPSYERQLRRYSDIWSRMGRGDVSAYLWYVHTGEVMRIV